MMGSDSLKQNYPSAFRAVEPVYRDLLYFSLKVIGDPFFKTTKAKDRGGDLIPAEFCDVVRSLKL